MQIIGCERDHVDELTQVYNDLTETVPHCYPIQSYELAEAFAGACGLESDGQRLAVETIFAAEEDGRLLGYVHVGEGFSKETNGNAGVIRLLAYPRGRRDVGQALLSQAEQWLSTREQRTVFVFPQAYRYPFYAYPHAFVSNRLEHVQALLLFNGYRASNGEVFLDWPNFEPKPPPEAIGIEYGVVATHEPLTERPNAERLPNITLTASRGIKQIGICKLLNVGGFSRQPGAEEVAFCMWLWVEESFQGRRLGSALLSGALVEAKRVGYRHAAISTAWDNHRALLFYSNCGFHAVDWTYQYRKTL